TRTLTLPSGDFEVAGNITFEAGSTLNAGSSTLVLNGSGLQTFSAGGNTLTNVTVNKTGGSDVDLTSQLIITGALEVSSANSDFGSNGNLVIRSTSDGASNNGRIGQLLNGASVSGDVVVERFMASEGRIYRYISAPVSGFTVASLQLDFPVTGTFTGTSSCTGCTTSQSMFSYNGATQTYVDFPADANTETLQAGIGYSAFIRQNVLGGPVTIDWTGPINQGSQSLAVSYNGTTSSWNLVGNPYPSTIDWDNTGWTKTNISGAISVRDNATGIYQTWNGSTGGLTGGRIATGQAFWARATGASPSLQVTETVKSSTTGAFFREAEIELDQFVLTLFDGIVEDHAYYWVSGDASNAVDDLDAPKLNNFRNTGSVPLIDLATYSHGDGSIPMAINSVNSLNCAEAIRIYTNDLDVGTYTLSLETFGSIKNMTWTLKDKFLNTEINFNENPSYEFTVTSDPNSKAVERFELIGVTGQTATLESSTVCKQGSSTLTATNIPAGANVNWYETATEGLVLGTGSSFMTPDLTSNKTYYAAVSNGGCEGSRVAVEAIVVKYDDVVITSDGNTLMSSYANGNQWLLNNVEIPGATGQSYEATESGLYSLVVAVGECQTSAEVQFAVTSAEDPFARLVNIYPNPTVDKFKLEIVSAGPVITKLFDAMGSLVNEKLLDGDSATKSAEFDLTGNSSGLYILRIQKGTSVHQVKIIKRK
ncbi:MAG TPA: T9SS type A sorting domain-containing protein, partial [Cyclobacteriaceae bacterium]|nr:T9SS type A sorting domain-containing protein [Cyclobacteriaceae bacterium]